VSLGLRIPLIESLPESEEGTVDALDLLLARRSIRRYTHEDVSPEEEHKLIDAAFAAPSASNVKPWHFVVMRDAATRARLARVHQWARMCARAPLVIAVLGRPDSTWWIEDCSAATENILLEAHSLGLGAVWVGMRDETAEGRRAEMSALEIIGAPTDGWRCLCVIAVGHPAETKAPRTQRQESKLSFERFGERSR
jgi:nitroreductase